jgi:hypothetical protein
MAAVREDAAEERARVAVAANLQAQRGTGFAFVMPPRPNVDSLITVLGNGSRRSVRDKGPMRLNPDAVEKLNELTVKESANQASGETQDKRNAKASPSQQQKKRAHSKSYTAPTPKTKKTKRRNGK